MAEKSFDDNDQSVYKTHILYYLPSDANCTKLLGMLESHPLYDEVFLQDVSQLRQRPPWLDGVPILVCKKDSQAYKGQHIQNYMKSYQSDEFLPASASTGGWSSYEDGEATMEKRFNTLHDPSLFDLEEEGGANGARAAVPVQGGGGGYAGNANSAQMSEKQQRKRQSEMEAQQRAQQMMSVRQQQDQMLQARSKGSTSLAPTPRNAFSGDTEYQPVVRHPPPVPATQHQRSAEARTPQYGQPQHYQYDQYVQQQTATAAQHAAQVPQFYAQQPQQQAAVSYAPQPSYQQHAAPPQYYQQQPTAPPQYYQQPATPQYYQQPTAPPQYYQQPPVQQEYYQPEPHFFY